jgi:hypothetical protein
MVLLFNVLDVVGMTILFAHAYTVAMAFGHPGRMKSGGASRVSTLDD